MADDGDASAPAPEPPAPESPAGKPPPPAARAAAAMGDAADDAPPWHAGITPALDMLPDPRRFHKPNLYALGVLCNIVYEEMVPEVFLELARKVNPGFVDVKVFDEGNAQAAIFEHGDFVAVVFRGTSSDDPDDGSDWGSNLEALMEIVEILHLKGRVHTGFWKYADMLWKDGESDGAPGLMTTLAALQAAKKRPIMVAGHSLGGAAAVLGAMRVVQQFGGDEILSQLATFGQPRCVGHALAKTLQDTLGARYCRVVRGVDIVPMVPPSIGYAHCGTLYYINEDETIVRNPGWLKQQIDRLVCWWGGGGGWFDAELSFVADHDMTEYWRLVRDATYEHEENAM